MENILKIYVKVGDYSSEFPWTFEGVEEAKKYLGLIHGLKEVMEAGQKFKQMIEAVKRD